MVFESKAHTSPVFQRSYVSGDIVAVLAADEFWLFRLREAAASRDEVLSGQWLVEHKQGTDGSHWKLADLGPDVIGRQNVIADVTIFMTKKRDESFVLNDKAHALLLARVFWEHEEDGDQPLKRGQIMDDGCLRKLFSLCKIVPSLVS